MSNNKKTAIRNLFVSSLLFSVLFAANHAFGAGADPKRGEELHGENCVTCHASLTEGNPNELYTRAKRRVDSFPGLKAQVERCQFSLALQWFDKDIDDVTAYLNDDFYHFSEAE